MDTLSYSRFCNKVLFFLNELDIVCQWHTNITIGVSLFYVERTDLNSSMCLLWLNCKTSWGIHDINTILRQMLNVKFISLIRQNIKKNSLTSCLPGMLRWREPRHKCRGGRDNPCGVSQTSAGTSRGWTLSGRWWRSPHPSRPCSPAPLRPPSLECWT